jgi:arsenite methyltransferase
MADQLVFDENASRQIEAMYLIGDAVRRRAIVRERLAVSPGERIVDVGCGPGFYCLELVEQTGSSGSVTGIDASPAMLALAQRRCAEHDNIDLLEGEATSLPIPDGAFDAALSVQVQEYIPDLERSLAELHRVLRPGGRVLVYDIDWQTLAIGGEAERTRRLVRAWDEHLAHPTLPQTLALRLRAAGFGEIRMSAHAFATLEFDRDSYGSNLVPFIGQFVAGRQGISEAEARDWVEEQRALGERGDFYFAVTQFCFTARRPSTDQ